MVERKLMVRFFECWLVLALAAVGVAGGEELSTVAYVVDRKGFDSMAHGWMMSGAVDDDPFEVAESEKRKFTEPVPLAERPIGTRFFKDGDRMWLLTGHLRDEEILRDERSWAVWNEETNRLVVHGTEREQRLVVEVWKSSNSCRRIATEVELIKVRCRELEWVQWSAEEIEKRGGEVLTSVVTTSRSAGKGKTTLGVTGGEVSLETEALEALARPDGEVLDVLVAFSAPVQHAEGPRTLDLKTCLSVFAGHRIYVEVGGADGGEETCLLGVKAEPQFMDGTPAWQWREFEDPTVKEALPGTGEKPPRFDVQDDGSVLSRWQVPPTFLDDLVESDPAGDDDPFAAADGGPGGDRSELVREVPTGESPGFPNANLVYDLARVMRRNGIQVPEGRWIHLHPKTWTLAAKLDLAETEILEILIDPGFDGRRDFKMIHGTVCLIEWSGDLAPGRIPTGARRLARAGAMARPGQKVTMRYGWPADRLEHGVSVEFEPNIGATERVIDMRVALEVAGLRAAKLSAGLTMTDGKPVVLPLGGEGGKKLGLVVTGRVIDGTGLAAKHEE